jgi:hypothetical protein
MSRYEKYKLYKFNFCDVDSLKILKPIGKILVTVNNIFATSCPCCQATRILTGLILAAIIGRYTA